MTWFVHFEEKIMGPFSTEQVVDSLKAGEISYSAYIWAKGQVEWVPVSEWEDNLEKFTTESEQSPSQLWKLRCGDQVTASLQMNEVVDKIKNMKQLHHVYVCPQEEEQWTPLYSSYTFMEALNLSRRNFLRAPLMGLAKVTRKGSRFSYVVKTATIGQGGIGVYGLGPNFEAGTTIELKVESEDLSTSLNIVGNIVYNTDKGFIGVQFTDLNAEAESVIIEYINRFTDKKQAA